MDSGQWASFAPDGARSEDAPVGADEDVLRSGEDAPVGANEVSGSRRTRKIQKNDIVTQMIGVSFTFPPRLFRGCFSCRDSGGRQVVAYRLMWRHCRFEKTIANNNDKCLKTPAAPE